MKLPELTSLVCGQPAGALAGAAIHGEIMTSSLGLSFASALAKEAPKEADMTRWFLMLPLVALMVGDRVALAQPVGSAYTVSSPDDLLWLARNRALWPEVKAALEGAVAAGSLRRSQVEAARHEYRFVNRPAQLLESIVASGFGGLGPAQQKEVATALVDGRLARKDVLRAQSTFRVHRAQSSLGLLSMAGERSLEPQHKMNISLGLKRGTITVRDVHKATKAFAKVSAARLIGRPSGR